MKSLDFNILPDGKNMVMGVGSALIDILVHADDGFLARLEAPKGGMLYVEPEFIDTVLAQTGAEPQVVPGGSACNTAVGVGMLGGRACFVGRCGQGKMGDFFVRSLQERNVLPAVARSQDATGRVLSIITPDAQRTMFTCLGAAAGLQLGDLEPCPFDEAAVVHIEGYLVFNRDFISAAMQRAKADGCLVSLDLASFNIVASERDFFDFLIDEYVDILFANEEEGRELTGLQNRDAILSAMAARAPLAILKLGAEGSLVRAGGRALRIPAQGDGKAVDTTGAGDLFAAGFLYGLLNDMTLADCGYLAAACGFEVCQVMGASIGQDRWQIIKEMI